MGIALVLLACWRVVGPPIVIIASCFFLYGRVGKYLPSFLQHRGFAWKRIITHLFITTEGVIGNPLGVCSTYIFLFILFGAFLEKTGIGQFFIDLANSLVGRFSGGPAKVAVISSALCGMVSGSSVGNTVTTGSVTIPMMKKTGYKPEFAGAVEAAASTGGQIMPPIMGAAAFLMAEYVGVPYSNIIVRAILPAILYFTGIFIAVHLEAKKLGLKGIDKDSLPVLKHLLRRVYLLLPLVILVYLVSSGNSTMAFAAAIAILFAVSVSNAHNNVILGITGIASLLFYLFLNVGGTVKLALLFISIACALACMLKKGAVMTPVVLFDALANGAKSSVTVAAACGVAGMIGGCITITGLASQIITAVITLSHGSLFIALFFTMLCCIVLGMGVPTTANYCIMASTCAPILIQLGVSTIAAHFFVFYFGIVADITPPVALAAYAGSAIAHAPPMKTAVNATKLAIAAFVVPYIFAMNPAMLFVNTSTLQVVLVVITSLIGIFGVSAALNGHLFCRINPLVRILFAAGGLLMLDPSVITDVIGIVLFAAAMVWQIVASKRQTAEPA
jgi:TRAP transporter 4TM/12TM fusion protein